MKKLWKNIACTAKVLLIIATLGIMIFTIVSVTTFNQKDKTLFGYRLFIVLSDSMRATDFEAGDLIFVEQIDTKSLVPGDIISFVSTDTENYGKIVTHKIREVHKDESGNQSFVTYGTTSGVNDEGMVVEHDVLGVYRMRIPKVGKFFSFLKTTQGYVLLVLLPFLLAIAYFGISSIQQFREYQMEQVEEIRREREALAQEKQSLMQLHEKEQKSTDRSADPL